MCFGETSKMAQTYKVCVPVNCLEAHLSFFQEVDSVLPSVGSAMGSSLHAACGTPLSGHRSPLTLLMRSQMPRPSHPFCSIRTSNNWLGSSWTGTRGCLSLSARNATPSSTSATASWSGFCRESIYRQSGKRTIGASESTLKIYKLQAFKMFDLKVFNYKKLFLAPQEDEKVSRPVWKPWLNRWGCFYLQILHKTLVRLSIPLFCCDILLFFF